MTYNSRCGQESSLNQEPGVINRSPRPFFEAFIQIIFFIQIAMIYN